MLQVSKASAAEFAKRQGRYEDQLGILQVINAAGVGAVEMITAGQGAQWFLLCLQGMESLMDVLLIAEEHRI